MVPLKILGLDLETNGLAIDTSRPLEIGFAVLDADRGQIMECHNYLVNQPGIKIEEEALKVHGLDLEVLQDHGHHPHYVLEKLESMMLGCNAICAHNGSSFDHPILKKEFERVHREMPDMVWIDTAQDIEYPDHITTRRMGYLAVEHGFMNPFAHRALFDVITMLRVLQQYDIDKVLKSAQTPTLKIRACVNFDDRAKAKERRYNWDPEKKIWWKHLKEHKLEREKEEAPFPVKVLRNGDQTGNPV